MEARNQELEQLTYITSHDLQEPLYNISNLIELLQEEYKGSLPEGVTEYLKFISESAGRMSQLINALLNYGRLGRNAEASFINCQELVNEACADLDAIIRETRAPGWRWGRCQNCTGIRPSSGFYSRT